MATIAELKREIKTSEKLIKESQMETKQREETLKDLIAELSIAQNKTTDWSKIKAGTLIRVGDDATQPTDWSLFYFYAYLPDAEYPLLVIHPDSRQQNKYGSLNQEALIAFKYGRELTDKEKDAYKDRLTRSVKGNII